MMRKIFCLLVSVALFLTGCGNEISQADDVLNGLYDDYCKAEEILFHADLDMEQKLLEDDIYTFYALSPEYECETVSQLEELLGKVYTKEKVKQLLETYVGDEGQIFKEIDGKLGRMPADAPGTYFELPVEETEKVNEEEIKVKAKVEDDTAYSVEIRLQKEDAGWRIAEVL